VEAQDATILAQLARLCSDLSLACMPGNNSLSVCHSLSARFRLGADVVTPCRKRTVRTIGDQRSYIVRMPSANGLLTSGPSCAEAILAILTVQLRPQCSMT